MNRPGSIIWFERLFFGSFAVSFIDMFVHRELLFSDEEFGDDLGLTFILAMLGVMIVSYGIQILLWFYTAHRASNIARWIYIILWIVGMVGLAIYIFDYTTSELIFFAVAQSLALGSVICLFTPEARFWFRSKGLIAEGDGEDLSDIFQ